MDTERRRLAWEVVRLRYWQHLVNEDLKAGKIPKVPVHVAIGNEAIAVAVCNMMQPEDELVLSHRNMAYNLARRGEFDPIYREYLMEPNGVAGGKLASMNLTQPELGIVYSSSILGNNVPVACGLALGKQTLGEHGIVIVMMGDGSIEEGSFYEGLVFSKTHRLRLLMIIENNDHSMSSTIDQRRCPIAVDDMCRAVEVPFRQMRGNDVWEYLDNVQEARQTVDEGGPMCLEVFVEALTSHSGPTPFGPSDPKELSLDNGLIVEQSRNDPVYVVEQSIPAAEMAEMTDRVFAEGRTGRTE